MSYFSGQKQSGWRWAPSLVDRYVAREFLFSYAVSTVVILSLRMLVDLFVKFDEFIEDGSQGAALRILGYYAPQLLVYFRDFSGMMVLVAAVFAMARMTRQNELTAMLASGVSLKRVIAPVILLGFVLNLLMVFDQEVLLPRMADKLTRRPDEMELVRRIPVQFLADRIKDDSLGGAVADNALLFAVSYDHQDQTMTDMLVIYRKDQQMVARLTAEKAHWDAEKKRWTLTNGRYFDESISRTNGPNTHVTTVRHYESDLTPSYLWVQRNSNFKSLMSSSDLSALLQRCTRTAERNEVISEKHFRFTDPIINMVMLMLGLPLLVSRERRSTKTATAFALAGAGGCFVTTFACKLLAGSTLPIVQDPLFAAWMPIIIFLPMSVVAMSELKT